MNYKTTFSSPLAQQQHVSVEPSPAEATIYQRTQELAGYLAEVRSAHASMRGILFGEGESEAKEPALPSSLAHLVSVLCSHAACLAGEAKTILSRL